MSTRTPTASFLIACALSLAACGNDDATEPTAVAPTTSTADAATTCPDVPAPGHLAEDVRATGLSCGETVAIANEAEGLGRAAYRFQGFSCKPESVAGGKTTYTCTKGEATLTFLYG